MKYDNDFYDKKAAEDLKAMTAALIEAGAEVVEHKGSYGEKWTKVSFAGQSETLNVRAASSSGSWSRRCEAVKISMDGIGARKKYGQATRWWRKTEDAAFDFKQIASEIIKALKERAENKKHSEDANRKAEQITKLGQVEFPQNGERIYASRKADGDWELSRICVYRITLDQLKRIDAILSESQPTNEKGAK